MNNNKIKIVAKKWMQNNILNKNLKKLVNSIIKDQENLLLMHQYKLKN